MEKPKKEDFEYYQNGLAFKTVNLIEYTKALELYINEIEALNMCVVGVTLKDKNTPKFEDWCEKNKVRGNAGQYWYNGRYIGFADLREYYKEYVENQP